MTYILKSMLKSLKLNTGSMNFINKSYIHINNVIFNKTVTKLFTILKKMIFTKAEPYKLP